MTKTQKIIKLRKLTGCSILDCKFALEEAGGNLDKAIRILFNNRPNNRWGIL